MAVNYMLRMQLTGGLMGQLTGAPYCHITSSLAILHPHLVNRVGRGF